MNRKTFLAAGGALVASALTLAACSGGGGGGDDNHLVLYSSMTDNDLNVFIDIVGAEFPDIDIEIVNGSAGELTTRIQSESGNPQGDMMWGGLDTADGDRYTDVFEHWLSDHEDELLPEYRSPNGFYNVDHLSTVAFAVNTDIEAELGLEINGYEDLLDPRLNGRIAMADPTSSSSAWNNISNIMAVYGYDTDESWDYIEALLDNGLVIVSSSSIPFASTEDGEYAVGLTYEDGIAALLKSGASHIRLVYPEEGTSASAFGTAVIEGAPNADLAKQVINYLMSPDGQAAYAEGSGTVRMTTSADYTLEFLPSYDEVTWVNRDVEWLTENRESVVDQWTELYTRSGGA
ncbi:extracellular solute-binding protein [Pseudactinotalea sp.]|uniref:extracellular solute-binding protein n=1 Tax=Pseudactinotalea sp. TaxID=1926260 RepID=UPI003B3AF1C1